MIMSVLLKCAREETLAAWMWRLSSASLKDRRETAEEEISFLQHFICLRRRSIQPPERRGLWGQEVFCGDPPCLTKCPQHWFLWDWLQGYCGSPNSFQVLPGRHCVVPCWVISPRCSGTMSCTAPCGSMLLKLSPRPVLLILLLGRTCLVGSAVVICWFLSSNCIEGRYGTLWMSSFWQQSMNGGFVGLKKTLLTWAANMDLPMSCKTH